MDSVSSTQLWWPDQRQSFCGVANDHLPEGPLFQEQPVSAKYADLPYTAAKRMLKLHISTVFTIYKSAHAQDVDQIYAKETLFLAVKDQNIPGKLCICGPPDAIVAELCVKQQFAIFIPRPRVVMKSHGANH